MRDIVKSGLSARSASQQFKLLSQMPDGLIYPRVEGPHKLSVWKEGHQLQLIFFSGTSTEIQSRLNLADPLYLLSPYTQVMMLGLVWTPEPKRIHIVGFGSGRLPMVLHSSFPDLTIDCTEIDQDVVRVAQEFFGVELDAKLRVVFRDGREFLEELNSAIQYDMILVDAFDGTGSSPYMLSTKEFYEHCAQHLTEGGVVVVNMLLSDKLYASKVKTFMAVFPGTWMVSTNNWGGSVFFGLRRGRFLQEDICQRARQLAATHRFSFPLEEHARNILGQEELNAALDAAPEASILTDSSMVMHHYALRS